jgi:hypothetical protein
MRLGTTLHSPAALPPQHLSQQQRDWFLLESIQPACHVNANSCCGAYLGSGPLFLIVAPNMMLFFVLQIGLIFCFFCGSEARFKYHCTF